MSIHTTPEGLAGDYSYREMKKALWTMNKGPIGFDLFRDERTRSKLGLARFMLERFGAVTVSKHCPPRPQVNDMGVGGEAGAGGQGGAGGGKGDAPDGEAGQGQGDGADKGEDAAQDAQDAQDGGKGENGDGEGQGEGQDGDGQNEGQDPVPANEHPLDRAIREKIAAAEQRIRSRMEQQRKATEQRLKELAGKKGEPREIVIKAPGKPNVAVEGHVHPIFDEVVALASQGLNVMLVGPMGCGKTHLMHAVSKALGRSFASISGSAGASESQLIGRLLPTGEGGKFEYHESPFIRQYEAKQGPSAFGFDEFDAFDPNMLIVTNQATANGGFTLELRRESTYVTKGDCLLLASANTYGVGADAMYVGRNQLDAATLDRWYVVPMDYDTAYEQTLAPKQVVEWVWGIRQKIAANRLRRGMSTRAIQKAAAALAAGRKWEEIRGRLLSGWTRDELAKIGVQG